MKSLVDPPAGIPAAKYDWKKSEKNLYLPKTTPVSLTVPSMRFFVIEGKGDPNSEAFAALVEALYSASYGLRMSSKSGFAPEGWYEYSVYPLEGVWDLSDAGKALISETKGTQSQGVAHLKDEFVFRLMIRQPEFLTQDWCDQNLPKLAMKKKQPLIERIRLVTIEEGLCAQILHCGPYDSEPESFALLDAYCKERALVRSAPTHREIYLSDARKTAPEKLKTVLRIPVVEAHHV